MEPEFVGFLNDIVPNPYVIVVTATNASWLIGESSKMYRIPGFSNYAISQSGDLIDLKNKKKLTAQTHVNICPDGESKQKRIAIARLLALTFIPNPNNKKRVVHLDGNNANNAIENIAWR